MDAGIGSWKYDLDRSSGIKEMFAASGKWDIYHGGNLFEIGERAEMERKRGEEKGEGGGGDIQREREGREKVREITGERISSQLCGTVYEPDDPR